MKRANKADLHGTTLSHATTAYDMIYDCCVRQKKCRSILKHVLKRCDNRKSCRRPVVSLSHATKSYRVNRPLDTSKGSEPKTSALTNRVMKPFS